MRVNEPEHGVTRPQNAFDGRPPFHEGPVPEVSAIQRKHVEREHRDERTIGGPETVTGRVEVAPFSAVQHHEFRIEDGPG